MCKAEKVEGVVAHPDALDPIYYGATNDSRTLAANLTLKELDIEKEMIIHGRVYDVSSFLKRHPGGSVIKFQLGTDATDAFDAFHPRSKKAQKMLKSLPNRDPDSKWEEDDLSPHLGLLSRVALAHELRYTRARHDTPLRPKC